MAGCRQILVSMPREINSFRKYGYFPLLKLVSQSDCKTISSKLSRPLGSKLAVVEGGGVDGDEVRDEWKPGVPITSPCDSVAVSDF